MNFENKRNAKLLKRHGFYSLTRLLRVPLNVNFDSVSSTGLKMTSDDYCAIVDSRGLAQLETLVLSSKICAIDTESDDKDPHRASLLGIAFSVQKKKAFFLPLLDKDLRGIGEKKVKAALRRIFDAPIKFVGHNIKYDYVLLKKHGITMKSIYFDTMLAAHDCFGNLDFLNLSFLAEKLLNQKIRPYKDIVKKDQTFLDLPFREMVQHACKDADITLQLYHVLDKELKGKSILEQYQEHTVPRIKELGDLEHNGVPIKFDKLQIIRRHLSDRMLDLKNKICAELGQSFNIDSQKDLVAVLKGKLNLNNPMELNTVRLPMLERLAIRHPTLRLIVEYKRFNKELKFIGSIFEANKNGKVHPIFIQVGVPSGQLSSKNPNLFNNEIHDLKTCLPENLKNYFKDTNQSWSILRDLTQDPIFKKDLKTKTEPSQFIKKLCPVMTPLDYQYFLLPIVIGVSDFSLSQHFMIEYPTGLQIRQNLEKRYFELFQWLEDFRRQVLKCGYAIINSKRKYLDIRSSNLEKRKKALDFAVRCLIRY